MLSAIAVILLVLWLLGIVSSYTLGGFIHLLPVTAVILVLLRPFSGRRQVADATRSNATATLSDPDLRSASS